jgi:hypothetical protein
VKGTLGSQQADHDLDILGSELVTKGDVQPRQVATLSNLRRQERRLFDIIHYQT